MNITIHIVPAAQAMPLQPFILPEVWEAEEREHFWYFAAMDEGALIGAAVIDPIKTGAELRSIAVSPAYTRQGVAATLLDRAVKALNYARIDTLWMTYVFTEEKWEVMDGLMKTSGFAMVMNARTGPATAFATPSASASAMRLGTSSPMTMEKYETISVMSTVAAMPAMLAKMPLPD